MSTCGRPAGETSRVLSPPTALTVPHRSGSSFVGQENATKLSLAQATGHCCSVEIHYDQFQCSSFKKELMHSFDFFSARLVAFKAFISNQTVMSTSHASLSWSCEVLCWCHSAASRDSLQRAATLGRSSSSSAAAAACLYTK